ncbi:MAG: NAD(P)H-hydrate dehydratase [Candidatus Heimdallarchaeota archaeon]|nr:NAD(P)H-hydrate dehydratase [Candidatus Heimdallarchaeota archaeon]MBY8993962.1 NAD(P)H-hydrate dehydratase [Candidatus Heimdallarchaeota archaeon]
MVIIAEEVKIIDLNSEELGVSVTQLMENAGAAVAQVVLEHYPKVKSIAICCGTGNNGGDGMVAARHLASLDRQIKLILLGSESKIRTTISIQNFKILKQMETSIEIITINDSSKITKMKKELDDAELIIDALLGVGITTEPYEPIKSAIKAVNSANKPIVSVDVPSGMFSDIPKKTKLMVKSDFIVTFHDTKPCLTIDGLKEKTVIKGIGVPLEAELFVGKGDLKLAIPKREITSHKGENGTVLVVGGSIKYSGAPVLASRAALRTGSDLVITCIPASIANSVRSDSPNMIVRELEGDYLTSNHIPEILEIFEKFDVMVLGPGMSDNPQSIKFVTEILEKVPKHKPIIIDADALKALPDNLGILKKIPIVLTPHKGEFKILFGDDLKKRWQDQIETVIEKTKNYNCTIVLKGKYDIISDGEKFKINRTGHEGMTVGGTGDVLAGILGSLCAVNSNLFRASCAASYLTGKAGEFAAEDFGNSLLATDVIEKIPEVLAQIRK